MQSTLNEPATEAWRQIAPLLDDAMGQARREGPQRHRAAVFREQKFARSRRGAGRERGRGENAREPRAGKTAEIFHETRRHAFGGGDCRSGFGQLGSSRAGGAGENNYCRRDCERVNCLASISTLVKGTMKMMTWMKLKFSGGRGRGGIAGRWRSDGGHLANRRWRRTDGAGNCRKYTRCLRRSFPVTATAGKSYSEMSGQSNALTFNIRLQRPNLYRIDWTQETGLTGVVSSDNGVVWSDGSGDYFQITATGPPGRRKRPIAKNART